jgi:hypothetical protein
MTERITAVMQSAALSNDLVHGQQDGSLVKDAARS